MAWVRRPRLRPPAPPLPDAGEGAPPPPPVEPPPAVDQVPSPRRMRHERRALARQREIEIRDVGGLAVEMVRRDRFRPELLVERANDVLRVEQRLHELDSLLFATVAARGEVRGAPPCRCGVPLLPGAHFCSHCGRPAPHTPAVRSCGHCRQPLPADANFCVVCGNSVAADELGGMGGEVDQTLVRPWPPGGERGGDA